MSQKDALPGWLRTFYIAVADAPMTNWKSANGEILTYMTFFAFVLAEAFNRTLTQWLVIAWLSFLAGKIGFAMGGAALKRATYKPMPPTPPDVEDVQATTATPKPDGSVLTKADADMVAKALNRGEQGE